MQSLLYRLPLVLVTDIARPLYVVCRHYTWIVVTMRDLSLLYVVYCNL
jgi:hypothetical protein